MPKQFVPHPDYDGLQSILTSMAEWARKRVRARAIRNELMNCDADEVARMACELKLGPRELAALETHGPDAAEQLKKLLVAVGLDSNSLENEEPAVMRDLQRLCTSCDEKKRCKFDLINGLMTENFRDYCPNAFTLDALLLEKQERRRRPRLRGSDSKRRK